MGELANCERCGNVFVKTIREICSDCYKEEEKGFEKVYKFMRLQKNRSATMQKIVEATEVEEELITKFIRQKRLTMTDFPNLTYPCERCGEGISEGTICYDCQKELKEDLEAFEKDEKKKEEQTNHSQIYYSIDKHRR